MKNEFVYNNYCYIFVIYQIDRKMGEYTKAKVTIDLEEYNTLLEGSSSNDPYKKLLGAIITTINMQSQFKPTLLSSVQDIVNIVRDCGLEIDIARHKDQIEVRGVKVKE